MSTQATMLNCNYSTLPELSGDNNATLCNVTTTTENPAWILPPFDVTPSSVTIAVILILLDVVTIVGNFLVLLAFAVEPRLRQPFNLFIMNLAVTDFFVAVTAMTFYTIDTLLSYWPFGKLMCGVWIYLDFAMTFSSVFTLVAISVDRFWCVTWAVNYKIHNSRRKTLVAIAVIWFCVVAIWTPPFISDRLADNMDVHTCIWEPSANRQFVVFVAVIGHYIPCVIMIGCYLKVLVVMRRQTRLVKPNLERGGASNHTGMPSGAGATEYVSDTADPSRNTAAVTRTTTVTTIAGGTAHVNGAASGGQIGTNGEKRMPAYSSNIRERDKRIFITLTYVLSSYIVCWFPFYIAFDTYAWEPHLVPETLYTVFFWMTYVNSTLNPFIYAYTSRDFRRALLKSIQLFYSCKA